MRKSRNNLLFIILILVFLPLNSFGESLSGNGFIVISNGSRAPRVLEFSDSKVVHLNIGLGEWDDKFILFYNYPKELDSKTIQIMQQNRSCLSLSMEGPHLDFIDWKKDVTPWKEMKQIHGDKWASVEFSNKNYLGFPNFTIEELKEQVKLQMPNYSSEWAPWFKLAEACVQEKSSCIMECEVEIRFFKKDDKFNKLLKIIKLILPMGC